MGDVFGEGDSDERPVHEVCLDDFYLGQYEATQRQWKKVMGNNPSKFALGDNYPVEQVSWSDIQDFIGKINLMTGNTSRLPTEAEWEYAARDRGKRERFAGFSGESSLPKYANCCDDDYGSKTEGPDNEYKKTVPVGKHRPNGLGLYDMSGNVWEFVQDWYDPAYYKTRAGNNPTGPDHGQKKAIRGGSWDYGPRSLRAADRDGIEPDKRSSSGGFRLALPANNAFAISKGKQYFLQ